jgi:hypothetical protein
MPEEDLRGYHNKTRAAGREVFAVKFFFTAKLAKNCRQDAKPNHARSETERLLSSQQPSGPLPDL